MSKTGVKDFTKPGRKTMVLLWLWWFCWLWWLWVGWLCRSRSRSNQLTHKKFVHRRETTSNDFHHDGQLLQIFVLYICLNLDPIGVLHHVPIYFEYALTCPMMKIFFSHWRPQNDSESIAPLPLQCVFWASVWFETLCLLGWVSVIKHLGTFCVLSLFL